MLVIYLGLSCRHLCLEIQTYSTMVTQVSIHIHTNRAAIIIWCSLMGRTCTDNSAKKLEETKKDKERWKTKSGLNVKGSSEVALLPAQSLINTHTHIGICRTMIVYEYIWWGSCDANHRVSSKHWASKRRKEHQIQLNQIHDSYLCTKSEYDAKLVCWSRACWQMHSNIVIAKMIVS